MRLFRLNNSIKTPGFKSSVLPTTLRGSGKNLSVPTLTITDFLHIQEKVSFAENLKIYIDFLFID